MIGEELRKRRERMGLTQVELGRALAVHPNTIAKWERGEQTIRHAGLLRFALSALDRDIVMARGDPAERGRVLTAWSAGNWTPHGEADTPNDK